MILSCVVKGEGGERMNREEELYQIFKEELRQEGKIQYSVANELFSLINDRDQITKRKYADEIYGFLSDNIILDVYLLSFCVRIDTDIKYIKRMQTLVMLSEELNWKQKYFIYQQIGSLIFLNPTLNEKDVVVAQWKLIEQIRDLCKKELTFELKPIPKDERNKDLVIVLTDQFLAIQHGPTKTALDRCYVIKKRMHKNAFLINTADALPLVGEVPFFMIQVGNHIPDYMEKTEVEWKGEKFAYYQCEEGMPDLEEIEQVLHAIIRLRPSMIVAIGGTSLVMAFANELVSTVSIGLTQSGVVTTLTDYQVVDYNMLDYVKPIVEQSGRTMDHIIPGKFTFSLKPQTEHITRHDIGISENAFVMAIVGGRLDTEITDEYLMMLESTMNERMMVVIIGVCDTYKDMIGRHPLLENHVINLGFCNDILSRLEICDLYINPIRSGGGTSVVEAMSKGKPAITVNYGDVAGIVGERFCCNTLDDMAQLIRRYESDKEFYREQSEYAKAVADEYMDSEREFERIMSEYAKRNNLSIDVD